MSLFLWQGQKGSPKGLPLPLRTGGESGCGSLQASQGLCPLWTHSSTLCRLLHAWQSPCGRGQLARSQVGDPYKVQVRARAAAASRPVRRDPAQAPLVLPAARPRSHWHCSPPQPK